MEGSKMKHRKLIDTCLAATMLSILIIGCTKERERYIFYRERAKVENNTPPFSTGYFEDERNRHVAVLFNIDNGVLTLADPQPQVRPGHMPYHPSTSAHFIVIYRDSNDFELGRYSIEDPRSLRSCEATNGTPGDITTITHGTLELLLPHDERITSMTLYPMPEDTVLFPNDTVQVNITW
jgi:hypothetical protein